MNPIKIITIDSPLKDILKKKAEDFCLNKLYLAKEIEEKLFLALKPHLPAAGLAAPQIGISKSVFIYSYDRDPKNFELVINPTYAPIENKKVEGWEGCFSVLLSDNVCQLAHVSRYKKIKVLYIDRKGEKVEKALEGFAAKVFQHECDHLQGIINIDRADATIKKFDKREDLFSFLERVKKEER